VGVRSAFASRVFSAGSPSTDRVVVSPFATTLRDGRAFYGLDVAYNGVLDQPVTGDRFATGYGFGGSVQVLGLGGITGGRVLQFAPTFPGASAGGGYATVFVGTGLFSQVCRMGPPPPECGIDIPLDFAPQLDPVGFANSVYLAADGTGGAVRLDRIRFGFAVGSSATVVPEPAAVAIVGAGLGLIGFWQTARRSRRE
jgi:hypothetical protein